MAELEKRLGTTMGLRLTPLERLIGGRGAVPLAAAWFVAFSIAAILILWWTNGDRAPEGGHAKLASLILWKAAYFPVLIGITRFETVRVLDIVRHDILPYASDEFAASVKQAIKDQHASWRFKLTPWLVAVIGSLASNWTIRDEIKPIWWTTSPFPVDLLLWILAVAGLSYLAMRVVVTATFPRLFAAALRHDQEALYPQCAAKSALVQGLAKLNRSLLIYWALVFMVLATVMLLALPEEPFGLAPGSTYLFVVMPLLGFFSLGLGTLVYLESEATIGSILKRYSIERAETLRRQIATMMNCGGEGDEATAARLDRLTRMHDQIVAGGCYGSRVGTLVSLALPLAMPAIGLAEKLFG